MEKNKTGKYLKYAIGEILLVVIGILIALQINNWNEKRNQLVQGKILMTEFIEETEDHINMFDWAINNLKNSIEGKEDVFKLKKITNLDIDSLYYFISDPNIDLTIDINTYEKIKNLGIYRISDNDKLNNEINIHFNKNVIGFNRVIEFAWNNHLERKKYFYSQDTFIANSDIIVSFDSISNEELRSNFIKFLNLPRTRTIINSIYYDNKSSLETVTRMREKTIELLEKIHDELLKSDPTIKPLPNYNIEKDLLVN